MRFVRTSEREERLRVEAAARGHALSEALLEAYTIFASVPQDLLGLGGSESSERTRYKLMGALLAAKDVAELDLEE